MPGSPGRWGTALLVFVLALGAAGCVSVPAAPGEGAATAATVSSVPSSTAGVASAPTPVATVPAAPPVQNTTPGPADTSTALTLPESFHYAVDIGSADASDDAVVTHITGIFDRNGDWSQSTRLGDPSSDQTSAVEESVVVGGTSYTRPEGETAWTRWPNLGFDESYGLVSPFTALRLYTLADQRTDRVPSLIAGAPGQTYKVEASISAATVKKLLSAGIAEIAADEETRSALEAQVAPLAIEQRITYWVGEDGRVYRAAATLQAADQSGKPAPWLAAEWRFWGYGDPAIAVRAPSDFQHASTSGPADQIAGMTATPVSGAAGKLVVNVFSAPGVPAQKLGVTVYPSGMSGQPLDWQTEPQAEFSLPPGTYDVLVQMDYAQEWLRGLPVAVGETTARDVVFDFGTLELAALRDGAPVPVEMVIYPAGDRQNWVDWRSENPATVSLRAGEYDVEIVAPGQNGIRRMLEGVVIRAGETKKETVELNP
jgi:hypothetical protein